MNCKRIKLVCWFPARQDHRSNLQSESTCDQDRNANIANIGNNEFRFYAISNSDHFSQEPIVLPFNPLGGVANKLLGGRKGGVEL